MSEATSNGVDFYLKEQCTGQQYLVMACKVAAKAWHSGYQVFVLSNDTEQSRRIDDLLWTFNQGSFIPHAVRGDDAGDERR